MPDELVPGGIGITHRPVHLDLAGGAAEREIPVPEQRGDPARVDAAWRWAAAAGGEREHEEHRPRLGRVGDRGDGPPERFIPQSVQAAAGRPGLPGQGVLRPGLTVARAADILWLYVGPWAYRVLVTERGWTLDEYQAWLADTLYTQVMSNG